jgi:SAM-dependent methyltransferase
LSRIVKDAYPERTLWGFSRVDGTVWFYTRVRALVQPVSVVLDIGCGRGARAEDPVDYRRSLATLRGTCSRVIGIDVAPDGSTNPLIDEFRLISDHQRWPIDDAAVDVALSDWVIEHVESPDRFFSECARVVKPGGYLCIRTPNLYGYPALFSKLIPNRARLKVLHSAQHDRKNIDVFPTLYRCNTKRRLTNIMTRVGFDPFVLLYEAEPSYLDFSRRAYGALAAINQHVPTPFKSTLHAFGRRLERP